MKPLPDQPKPSRIPSPNKNGIGWPPTRSFRVAGPKAFPPFHYYDPEGKVQGIAPDIVKSLLTKLGVKVQYSPGLPWPQVLAKAKAREIDLIALAAKSKDREEYLLFSKPYMSFPLVIMTRRNFRFVGGLDDLHGMNTALIRGVPTSKWLQREGIAVKPYPVDSPLAALEAVSLGKADASIHNLGAATYLIEKHNLNNLQVAAPTSWGDYQVHFAVRKDWPLLVSILNKTMAAMSPTQKSAIRNQWISVRFEHGIRVLDVALWVGPGGSRGLGIAAALFPAQPKPTQRGAGAQSRPKGARGKHRKAAGRPD